MMYTISMQVPTEVRRGHQIKFSVTSVTGSVGSGNQTSVSSERAARARHR